MMIKNHRKINLWHDNIRGNKNKASLQNLQQIPWFFIHKNEKKQKIPDCESGSLNLSPEFKVYKRRQMLKIQTKLKLKFPIIKTKANATVTVAYLNNKNELFLFHVTF